MKQVIMALFGILLLANANAQTKTTVGSITDSIGNVVIHYLSAHQADSIYMLAGKDFKAKISQAAFKSISENQLFPLNSFKDVVFVENLGGINKYKVNGTPELQLLIGLDSEKKIETLLIQPYQEQ